MRFRAVWLLSGACCLVTATLSCSSSERLSPLGSGGAGGQGGGASTSHHGSSSSSSGEGGAGAAGAAGGIGGAAGAGGTGGSGSKLDCDPPTGSIPDLKLTPLVIQGLGPIVGLKFAPGDDSRLYAVDQSGRIDIIKDGVLLPDPFLDISSLVLNDFGEEGLLGLAFHPGYAKNGRFFVYYSLVDTGAMTIAEFARSAADADKADADAKAVLLSVDTLQGNHNGGALEFGPNDGFLYIGWGDGGDEYDQHSLCGNAQDKNDLHGKILRIDVDHADTKSDKPYTPKGVVSGGAPEVWDYGLRNPWRITFDGCTGDLYIGDVGEETHEEIDYEPAGEGGKNYGWRCFEGDEPTPFCTNTCGSPILCGACPGDCSNPVVCAFDNSTCACDTLSTTKPVISLPRAEALTIIGGYVYRGSKIQGLRGSYLFADATTRFIWTTSADTGWAYVDHFGGLLGIAPVSFGQDHEGELYVADYAGGIYRIDAK